MVKFIRSVIIKSGRKRETVNLLQSTEYKATKHSMILEYTLNSEMLYIKEQVNGLNSPKN